MEISRHGNRLTVAGRQTSAGEQAPAFQLPDLTGQLVDLKELLTKPLLISVVPDIDTRVCRIQTKRFNQEAAAETALNFVTISNNTLEEQAQWCGAEGVDMLMLHDRAGDFGQAYGLFVPETGRLVRSLFVVDRQGIIQYQELVIEQTEEPDYQAALAAAKALI